MRLVNKNDCCNKNDYFLKQCFYHAELNLHSVGMKPASLREQKPMIIFLKLKLIIGPSLVLLSANNFSLKYA